MATSVIEGRRIQIRGTVQGVGFRPWVYRLARELSVRGRVLNDASGVVIDAFAPGEALERFVRRLRESAPPAAVISSLECRPIPAEPVGDFAILESRGGADRRVSIPADLATCGDCAREIRDPANRRHRYPFTNCTNCGPRFTIAHDVPYDRARTSMSGFPMCPACRREYEDPSDRRFHAQPNACPACGPTLTAVAADGEPIEHEDPIALAARLIEAGLIVAVKGIGGFHLACDATSEMAVLRLRRRKRRDEKPFAVMARDLDAAEQLAVLGPSERALLLSSERPIVLAERRRSAPLAEAVAPGNPLVGVLLPYSPLHHLLMREVTAPLVMTSGNLSDEPLAFRNDEARERLAEVADLFLMHDRPIVTRCDDSVVRVIGGAPVVLRRSRGYVPRPITVSRPFAAPVLACGALLKNTFCFGIGDRAYLGPHIGDLENLETFESFRESIERMQRFLGVEPEIIAHDLHPDYFSTRYALARPEAKKIGVQHHHAHVVSALAEHGVKGPVFGVAYDGTGYGTDGASWGGELLLADPSGFQRLATFRPIALPGGDRAIKEPWRIAIAALEDAFHGEPPVRDLPLFRSIRDEDVAVVRRMLASGLNAPPAHGIGRYFDALAAIGLDRARASFEGQLALEWNMAAARALPRERGRYPFEIVRDATPWVVDLRPMVRDAVYELIGGEEPALVAARFHNTLSAATAQLVRQASTLFGSRSVVLTGGCFQNAELAELVVAELTPAFRVLLHRQVPPGDGGLALGQAIVAGVRSDPKEPLCVSACPAGS
ncbi:MAG TPA: carbamoyltransferase HypF [Vicinamibacterales bacterium]|nr:carbamoyltransferase HypF [Vicinamibacterales bacterium]